MKHILILAHGIIAKRFIGWIAHKRVAQNRYTVLYRDEESFDDSIKRHVTLIHADPTSYVRVKEIMDETKFSQVFVVMDTLDDTRFAMKNVRMIDNRVLLLVVNKWDESVTQGEHNVTVLDVNDLMAAHLYDHLPNVPLVAQNVGLGQGDIMEILVPFGSGYAYRHVGSILQRNWRIAALYRDDRLIVPSATTMIRPNDTILAVGKPIVLEGVYKAVNKRIGLFPEPFGKDLYLFIDLSFDSSRVLRMVQEATFLTQKLEQKHLYIRLISPGNFDLIDAIKKHECDNVTLLIDYENSGLDTLKKDISDLDIGLVMCGQKRLKAQGLEGLLFDLRKLIFVFGEKPIYNIRKSLVLMDKKEVMETISTTAFDLSEALGLNLCLCDFDPEGEFEDSRIVTEHYETLSELFNTTIEIKQKTANPVREVKKMDHVLQIAPYTDQEEESFFLSLIGTNMWVFLLKDPTHPKLLVPYTAIEKEELIAT